ncbi:MAG TPA: DegV family protein [Smithellaceae bacterium]|nr:DegV family protein [Smithellaceae bacterium]
MDKLLKDSFVTGAERVAAWADLLDAINVFPVADGDTGRNLSISLYPLRAADADRKKVVEQLLFSARGNSGNIASRFFSSFYLADSIADLAGKAQEGRKSAWRAVSDPCTGTMLSLFDALAEVLSATQSVAVKEAAVRILNRLEKAVQETRNTLPKLRDAQVVDAGALGMYIFFEGFFYALAGGPDNQRSVTEIFKNSLRISSSFREEMDNGYCVDFVVEAKNYSPEQLAEITRGQDNAVIIPEGNIYKIHLHTENAEKIKGQVKQLGSMLHWEEDNLSYQIREFMNAQAGQSMNIMTDAAGSVTRADAKKYGITLLNSYLTVGDKCMPETYYQPEELYDPMRQGIKVSTSQASVYERHQFYQAALARFEKVLYLCVGSVFTGNYHVALDWKEAHDKENRFFIVDTGAASGRLGVIALAVARYLAQTNDMEKTRSFAQKVINSCEEYVFLDKLHYLAAGGRLSKASAFFGDMLKMKPVISPQPEGARKMGVVRNQQDQLKMAREKLEASLQKDSRAFIMLEYSDNFEWVNKTVKKFVGQLYPRTEIILQPLSLTSGAHMGPGTWAVAFLPEFALL